METQCVKCGCSLTDIDSVYGICWECREENGGQYTSECTEWLIVTAKMLAG